MMYSVALLAASAALVSAQAVTYDPATGVFTCPADNPNGAFCSDNSGTTNIIIRCSNGIGQPGNCNDNLSGTFPIGLSYSPCYQTTPTAGDAACSKNCIVYGGSGNANGTFPKPDCTPTTTRSTVSATSTPVSSSSASSVSASITTIPTYSASSSASGSTTITSTGTTTCTTDGTTTTKTFTTTYCPDVTLSTVTLPHPTSSVSSAPSNGTVPTSAAPVNNSTVTTVGPSGTKTATATPVGPTSTKSASPTFTGGAIANNAGAGLAAIGLVFAYFL